MKDADILRELRRLQKEVEKNKRRHSESSEKSRSRSPEPPPPPAKRRRLRIISSDSEHEPDDDSNNVTNENTTASENDILSVLGEDPTAVKEFGEDIHAHVAIRWNNILQKGLKKENRAELIKQYLPPSNCTLILPPKLNDEIKAAVQESAVKRDAKIEHKQIQLGAGITCIGKAIDIALKVQDSDLRGQIIKHLGDSGQILADLHHLESLTRRSLISQSLNKQTKEATKDLPRDKLLFGEGLSEKLRAIKACSKSAADLKVRPSKPSTSYRQQRNDTIRSFGNTTEALNWRGSSRRFPNSGALTAGAYRERRAATAPTATPAAGRRAQTGTRQLQTKRS